MSMHSFDTDKWIRSIPAGSPVTIDSEYRRDGEPLAGTNFRLPPKRKSFRVIYVWGQDWDGNERDRDDFDNYEAVEQTTVYFERDGKTWRTWVPVMAIEEMVHAVAQAFEDSISSFEPEAVRAKLERSDEEAWMIIDGEDKHGRPIAHTYTLYPFGVFRDGAGYVPAMRWISHWSVEQQNYTWIDEHWAYSDTESVSSL